MNPERIFVLVGMALSRAAMAQSDPPPDYDFHWATIGHAFNRATLPSEVPDRPWLRIGRVEHRYRMSTSEVTVGQWFDFVNAYAPYWDGWINDPDFTSLHIFHDGQEFRIEQGAENWPVRIPFLQAARYVNWLHSGKGASKEDFERGAYDLSTFYEGENGWHGQEARSPGSQFWIPSWDEWVKAAYFDPDRYGDGEVGYCELAHSRWTV